MLYSNGLISLDWYVIWIPYTPQCVAPVSMKFVVRCFHYLNTSSNGACHIWLYKSSNLTVSFCIQPILVLLPTLLFWWMCIIIKYHAWGSSWLLPKNTLSGHLQNSQYLVCTLLRFHLWWLIYELNDDTLHYSFHSEYIWASGQVVPIYMCVPLPIITPIILSLAQILQCIIFHIHCKNFIAKDNCLIISWQFDCQSTRAVLK